MTIYQIQIRRGTATTWTNTNPILASGEMGYETDTGNFKFGDGSTAWNELSNSGDKYELFTLGATNISNKYVELVGIINDNQSIRVFVDNIGIKAEQGIDYSVSGNQIFWNTYELQSLLEEGDKLKIFYI